MTAVKICGITNLDDALCAADAGADLLGFIFYPPSPRSVTVDAARDISAALRQSTLTLVGVFVNESPAHMLDVIARTGLDAIQLSGKETAETLLALNGRGYKVVRGKAWAAERGDWDAALAACPPAPHLPDLLLEADHEHLYGGTGQRADEALAAQLARERRLLLAGGLTPDNVAAAVHAVQPWGVDVASGTERSPGRKDHAKVRAFVKAAKGSSQF
jgi:phosphoribosylanthranilate isomerase